MTRAFSTSYQLLLRFALLGALFTGCSVSASGNDETYTEEPHTEEHCALVASDSCYRRAVDRATECAGNFFGTFNNGRTLCTEQSTGRYVEFGEIVDVFPVNYEMSVFNEDGSLCFGFQLNDQGAGSELETLQGTVSMNKQGLRDEIICEDGRRELIPGAAFFECPGGHTFPFIAASAQDENLSIGFQHTDLYISCVAADDDNR